MKRGMHTRRGLLGELWERVDGTVRVAVKWRRCFFITFDVSRVLLLQS